MPAAAEPDPKHRAVEVTLVEAFEQLVGLI